MRNFIEFLKFQKFQKKDCKSFKLFSSTYALIYTLVCTLMLSSIFNFTTFANSIPYVSLDLRYDGEDHKYYQPKVYLEIDGKLLDDEDLPLEPVLIGERTLVPAREVFEEVGAEVEWNQEEYSVLVTYEDILVKMYIDTLTATKTENGNIEVLTMDVPPMLINSKTMIPVRFASESIGLEVEWINETRVVQITTPGKEVEEEEEEEVEEEEIELIDLNSITLDLKNDGLFELEFSDVVDDFDVNYLDDDDKVLAIDFYHTVSLLDDDFLDDLNLEEDYPSIESIEVSTLEDDENTTRVTFNLVDSLQSNYSFDDETFTFYISFVQPKITLLETYIEEIEVNDSEEDEEDEESSEFFDIIKLTSNYNLTESDYSITYTESDDEDSQNELTIKFEKAMLNDLFPELSATYLIKSLSYLPLVDEDDDQAKEDVFEINFYFDENIVYNSFTDGDTLFIKVAKESYTGFEESLEEDEEEFLEEDEDEEDSFVLGHNSGTNSGGDILDDLLSGGFFDNIGNTNTSTTTSPSTGTLYPGAQGNDPVAITNNVLIIKKPTNSNFNLSSVSYTDAYQNKNYTINFNADLSSTIGAGTYPLTSSYASSATVIHSGGTTQLSITCTKIMEVIILENSTSIYICLVHPQEKYDHVIVIDPGHGGHDPGAISADGIVYEKTVALTVAQRLQSMLAAHSNIKVYMTRTGDTYPELSERAAMANEVADFFISIHYNSFTSTSANGTETYYYSGSNNSNSSGLTSSTLASIVQSNLVSKLGLMNRGVKTANFQVLRETTKPGILAEIAFLSNPSDLSKIKVDSFQTSAASGLYNAIISITNSYKNNRTSSIYSNNYYY